MHIPIPQVMLIFFFFFQKVTSLSPLTVVVYEPLAQFFCAFILIAIQSFKKQILSGGYVISLCILPCCITPLFIYFTQCFKCLPLCIFLFLGALWPGVKSENGLIQTLNSPTVLTCSSGVTNSQTSSVLYSYPVQGKNIFFIILGL